MAPPDFPAGGYVRDYVAFWAVWVVLLLATVLFFRRTRAWTGRGRLVLGNLLVFASLLWMAVVAGETYLRYVYDATDSYGLTLTNFSWFKRHYVASSDGFRDREYDPTARPGVARVACVGDSFTAGYGVPDAADAWPQRVGAQLATARPGRFEVYNCGLIGHETGDELDLVRFLSNPRVADHVIVGYCLNDVDDLMPPGHRFDRGDAPRVPWIAPTRSFVLDFLWFRLKLRDDPRVRGYFDWVEGAYADPALMARQAERFRQMAEVCRASGMRLDVVVFPFLSGWGENYRFDAAHDRVAAAWKSAAGVDVIDLRDAYRGIPGDQLVVNRFDAHPNARAHAIAAQTILARVFGVR